MRLPRLLLLVGVLGAFAIVSFDAHAAVEDIAHGRMSLIWAALTLLCSSGAFWLAVEHRAYRREIEQNEKTTSTSLAALSQGAAAAQQGQRPQKAA